MMYFKRITHLPPIPPELLTISVEKIFGVLDSGYGKRFIKDDRLLNNTSVIYGVPTNPLLIEWVAKHLPGTVKKDITFQIIEHPTGGTHIVHCDVSRKYALNYIFDTGGHDAYTSWYQEKGKPLHRTKDSGLKQTTEGVVNYEDLELLASVRIPVNTWILIASDILHDVDVVIGQRKSVSISIFDDETLTKLGLL